MGYVAVTGGQKAIEAADQLNLWYRLKDTEHSLETTDIEKQLRHLVDRVMSESGLYAPNYAALAIKQAEGDLCEAAFLMRAYRSTLERTYESLTIDPGRMRVIRRISSAFKDIPGGQILGPTMDYTHRLLNFSLNHENSAEMMNILREKVPDLKLSQPPVFQKVAKLLREQGLLFPPKSSGTLFDITRDKLSFPAPRSAKLQILARGETGAMTALAYSNMRSHIANHPTIGELRVGYAEVTIAYPLDASESICLGEIMITEVETINAFERDEQGEVKLRLGYGLTFGQNETKAIAMAILEQSLETEGPSPTQDEEFVLLHVDSIEANGFVSHLKLPHYITFQSKLDVLRQTQKIATATADKKRQINAQKEGQNDAGKAETNI
ncbi:carbon-phosphorus lyase complex subunit PhnI [Sporolactobacillus sp. CPB3-1]|uniref:Carbon-phosphorus lyase complex subunit PhnI n=1 Tax=Sporolactobacillus mangiferae TaxID=2940498 RepID=A0ABT0MBB0_9BACL|nr:carbon-phosphorus lyase complex subunit PhnI [Sporolactobacillus mangiferae]MCL1632161.1 carbon-phosphorus lyase complex subunit PhnI [Sporolactobacillus mangiferae]